MKRQACIHRPRSLWLGHWLLAVALLLAQHAGWVHGLSHLGPAHAAHAHTQSVLDHGHSHGTHDQTPNHAEQVCEACLALAGLAHGLLPSEAAAQPLAALPHGVVFHSPNWLTTAVSLAYQSRAPPRA
jgi:hypothetical protein